MRKIILLCSLLAAFPALALDVVQGRIISSGASVNNLTTATPFSVPSGPILVQCNADTYVTVGAANDTVSNSSTGVLIPAGAMYETSVNVSIRVVAILPVSGASTCKVFTVIGSLSLRRSLGIGGGGGACTLDDTSPAIAPQFQATANTGSGFQCNGVLNTCFKLGPGANNYIGTNASGEILLGPSGGSATIARVYGTLYAVTMSSVNISSTNLLNAPLVGFAAATTLPPCDSGLVRYMKAIDFAPGSGTRTRLCLCTTDNAPTPAYRWQNVLTGTVGATTTECPA